MFQERQEDTQGQKSISKNLLPVSGKTTPRQEFPELRCPEHKQPVFLVCTRSDCKYRIFLCAKCVSTQINHINEHNPLTEFDDFVRYISTDSGLNSYPSNESMQLAQEKKSNIQKFNRDINEQKQNAQNLVKELQNLYQNKCSELVTSLQNTLEDEKKIFEENYTKYESEIKSDKEQSAEIPKFNEIKEQIAIIKDHQAIEDYIRNHLRKKQAWEKASIELRTLGKRSEDYYRTIVENQLQDKPQFANTSKIIQFWNDGLNNLIQGVKEQSDCLEGLFQRKEGIILNISCIEEAKLITNKMVKDDTELSLNFENKTLDTNQSNELSVALGKLTNLRYLFINLNQNNLNAESLSSILTSVGTLVNLRELRFKAFGTKNKNAGALELSKILPNLTNLTHLTIDLGRNELGDEGVIALSQAISQLTNLSNLSIDLKYNHIKKEGTEALGNTISTLHKLQVLSVNLGGYSLIKNNITEDGAKVLVQGLKNLKGLRELEVDLGYTGLNDVVLTELALSLKQLLNLRRVSLSLYSNEFKQRGAIKIAKALSKLSELRNLTLNLNNNHLQEEGAREVVNTFRRSNKLTGLQLFLRNVEMNKNEGKSFKADLQKEKIGQPFTELEVYI